MFSPPFVPTTGPSPVSVLHSRALHFLFLVLGRGSYGRILQTADSTWHCTSANCESVHGPSLSCNITPRSPSPTAPCPRLHVRLPPLRPRLQTLGLVLDSRVGWARVWAQAFTLLGFRVGMASASMLLCLFHPFSSIFSSSSPVSSSSSSSSSSLQVRYSESCLSTLRQMHCTPKMPVARLSQSTLPPYQPKRYCPTHCQLACSVK